MKRLAKTKGFTLVELLVVIGIIALLISILLPSLNRARETANRVKCAANLHSISMAILLYTNENGGAYPRTIYSGGTVVPLIPQDVGAVANGDSADTPNTPFNGFGTTHVNNIPQCLFLLLNTESAAVGQFNCPSAAQTPDNYGGGTNTSANWVNFQTLQGSLSYSYANPYPDATALAAGYRLVYGLDANFAVMADINPGTTGATGDNVLQVTTSSSAAQARYGNSNNHNKEGQNVLFADGHCQWQQTCMCGVSQDNIYTRGGAANGLASDTLMSLEDSPYGPNDSVLLPTDSEN